MSEVDPVGRNSNPRSAVDVIRGYLYQFDLTILKALSLPDHHSLSVEEIEDIDIQNATETTAIQCKYYEQSVYNHSVISEPIRKMFTHFIKEGGMKNGTHYKLYGKFSGGQEKLPELITPEFVKDSFFSYTKKKEKHDHQVESGASDLDVEKFVKSLTLDINAPSFDDQQRAINAELERCLSCSAQEAEFFYYNNALNAVRKLCSNRDPGKRRITKREFLEAISTKDILFSRWLIELKGAAAYVKEVRKKYFNLGLNTSPFERFFLIEKVRGTQGRASTIKLILLIQKKWSKLSAREEQSFCPYIYLHNYSPEEIVEIKTALREAGFANIDGYDFKDAKFSVESISRQATHQNRIKIKFANELEEIDAIISASKKICEIFQFYKSVPYFECLSKSALHIKIAIDSEESMESIVK